MSFFKKPTIDSYTADGYYDAEPIGAAKPSVAEPSEKTPGTTLNLGGSNMELKVVYPTSFAEVTKIADHLLSGCTVFLNLEKAERELTRRILDFVAGVAYCVDGDIKKVSNATFIVSPSSVDVSETGYAVSGLDPEF